MQFKDAVLQRVVRISYISFTKGTPFQVYGVCCSLRHTSQEQSPLIENVDEASSRIVNGLNTYPGELPFMVYSYLH